MKKLFLMFALLAPMLANAQSRGPDDLPTFCRKLADVANIAAQYFSEGHTLADWGKLLRDPRFDQTNAQVMFMVGEGVKQQGWAPYEAGANMYRACMTTDFNNRK